jgi:hypothetical protein
MTEDRKQSTENRGRMSQILRFQLSDISQQITENRGQTIDKVFHPPVFTI